jgi:hypothetical protein
MSRTSKIKIYSTVAFLSMFVTVDASTPVDALGGFGPDAGISALADSPGVGPSSSGGALIDVQVQAASDAASGRPSPAVDPGVGAIVPAVGDVVGGLLGR